MTGSSRLDDLALAERWFGVKGEGDRWQQLLGQARKDALLEKDDSIEVTCGKEALEPLYRQLLEALEKQGCHVCYRPAAADEALHAEKDVLQFKNDIEMAEWLAQQALDEGDAVVCDDTSILNLVLALFVYYCGSAGFFLIPLYLILELIVFAAEAAVYKHELAGGHPVLYALAANAASFLAGLGLAELLPSLF